MKKRDRVNNQGATAFREGDQGTPLRDAPDDQNRRGSIQVDFTFDRRGEMSSFVNYETEIRQGVERVPISSCSISVSRDNLMKFSGVPEREKRSSSTHSADYPRGNPKSRTDLPNKKKGLSLSSLGERPPKGSVSFDNSTPLSHGLLPARLEAPAAISEEEALLSSTPSSQSREKSGVSSGGTTLKSSSAVTASRTRSSGTRGSTSGKTVTLSRDKSGVSSNTLATTSASSLTHSKGRSAVSDDEDDEDDRSNESLVKKR